MRRFWSKLTPQAKKKPLRREAVALELLETRNLLSGVVTGRVFQDFNANGVFNTTSTLNNAGLAGTVGLAVDQGVGGVTVRAFDGANTQQGTATTAADGTYTLNVGGTGPYRVEFGTPAGFFPSAHGTGTGTAVQFLPDGNSGGINYGLLQTNNYVQDGDFELVTVCYIQGDQNSDAPVIISFPYSAGSNSTTNENSYAVPALHNLAVPARRVGTVWGLGYNKQSRVVYAGAFFKKHSGFGPGGTGAVYAIPRDNQTNVTVLADLNAVFGANTAGANAHNTANYLTDNFNTGWDAVGKTALGGLDVSADGSTVFVMNLADRNLYAIPTSGPVNATTVRRAQIPLNAPGATGVGGADLRPFAVQFHNGQVYVGVVNSAEATQNTADLRAYVYTVDPATMTFSNAPVFQMNLNFPRGDAQSGPGQLGLWNPWSPVFRANDPNSQVHTYPQPMLTGISFDTQGNMSLGFRDRLGDQSGPQVPSDPADPLRLRSGATAGDLLMAFINTPGNLSSGWTLENNGRGPAGQGTGPQNTGQGPGGVGTRAQDGGLVNGSAEFYFRDNLTAGVSPSEQTTTGNVHDELDLGGILQLPGFPDILTTAFDPIPIPNAFNRGGLHWYSNTTGGFTKGYQLYDNNTQPLAFAKANGIGDLVALVDPTPIEIGNRVWEDLNGNGLQDPGEPNFANLTVLLFKGGVQISSTTTNANGEYYFNAANVTGGILPNMAYEIRIDKTVAALNGYNVTAANVNANASDAIDSDATMVGNNAVISLTTGAEGASDHTFDFGFNNPNPLSLGNLVFNDSNNNGTRDTGEAGLSGVTVRLLNSAGTATIDTMTTDGNGNYLFSRLAPGDYIVEVVLPAGFTSSTGTPASLTGPFEPAPDPDNNPANDDDNGTLFSATVVRSAAVTLQTNTEPTTDGDTDANSNLSVDFGLFQPMTLGNQVWNDVNNNGLLDPGESGIQNVTLNLYADANNDGTPDGAALATATTNATGHYLFRNLLPGTYVVEAVTPTGFVTSTGTLASATGPVEPAPDADTDTDDNDDNGSRFSATLVRSLPVTLSPGTEPTAEAATTGISDAALDANSNLTVDFGFFVPLTLGNLIFNDANNNGTRDAAEGPVTTPMTVRLLDAANNVLATTTSNALGQYSFTNLIPGTYKVEVVPPTGFVSSTGTNASPTGPFEPGADPENNVNDDDNGTTVSGVVRSGTITLATGGEPTTDGDNDANTNLTLDFGLLQPLRLGNLVWNDQNNSGTFDPGEPGVTGVTVRLLNAAATTVLATTTTNAGGLYEFGFLQPGDYVVEVVPPAGFVSSTGAANAFEPGADPNNNTDNDDNGTTTATPGGTVLRSAVVTLALGAEPTNDGDADANSNLSVDFGLFQPMTLGNLVFNDANNNGVRDAGEAGLGGLTVRLLDATGNTVLTTTVTDTNAGTLGQYRFVNLAPGDYVVEVVPPPGFVSSSGTNGSPAGLFEPAPDPDTNVDNDDNGNTAGATIRSAPVTLVAGTEPVTDGDTDASTNLTVDFGLFPMLSLGNTVWNDANNNGLLDAGESGIANVPVRLFDATGTTVLATATTNATGNYRFTHLVPGDYLVEITPPANFVSSTGQNGAATGPTEPAADPDNNIDNDDNGSMTGALIRSLVVTLATGGEPISDGDNDPNTNLTVDFGLFQPLALGDRVFDDANNNGLFDPGEQGLDNVTVRLFDGAGTVQLGVTTTANNGRYLFTNVAPGDYVVEITAPAGFVSSTGANGSATGPSEPAPDPDNNANSDDNGTTAGAVIRSLAVTLTPFGEPNNDGDTDTNTNLSVDFGLFRPMALGDLVFNDVNNNGLFDNNESGVGGVTVRLYDGTGTTLLAATVTDTAAGTLGRYRFIPLAAGSYVVEVVPPAGFISSSGNNGQPTGPSEPAPGPDNDTNNDDNGSASGLVIRALAVTLAPGTEPTTDGDNDANTNLTVDFGIHQQLSLGNLVFNDANNNGVQDAGELGIPNVPVRLLNAAGTTVLVSTATDANGLYQFTNLSAGDYVVEVSPPTGLVSSTGALGSATGPFEPAPDPDTNPTNGDDNGTTATGNVIRSAVVTLTVNGEPLNDGDPNAATDGNSNLTVDFGLFQPLALGNSVYNDLNNNGRQDTGEPGVNGLPVRLLAENGTTELGRTTTVNGAYLFTNLVPGNYVVEVTPPTGFVSSTGSGPGNATTGPSEPGPDPDNDADGDDNGTQSGNVIRSSPVTLAVGTEPINDGDSNANTNLTVDFGIRQPVSLTLGNLVWNDQNNNGTRDAGEPGLSGVTVRLFDGNGTTQLDQTQTDANGLYQFTGLAGGNYVVQVTLPTGFVTSTGQPGSASGPAEPASDPDNNTDNDDNGTRQTAPGTVRSAAVTLAFDGEPVNDGDTDANTNLTVDFGLFQALAVGDLVFNDVNNNGVRDAGEPGLSGVAVRLFNGAGTTEVANTTTDANGLYSFTNLPAGDYLIEAAPPSGFVTSTGTNGSATGPFEPAPDPDNNADNDDNGSAAGNVVRSLPFTLAVGAEPVNEDEDNNTNLTVDVGLYRPSSLAGVVYRDDNNNGARNPNEPGIGNVTVTLRDGNNNVVATTTTRPDGTYSFPNLAPGNYQITESQPAGFTDGLDSVGDQGGQPGNDQLSSIPLGSGVNGVNYNFGEIALGSLAGFVYRDTSTNPAHVNDGFRQPGEGESGIPNVTITLSGTEDTGTPVSRTTTTGSDGSYRFDNLLPGTYQVTEQQPAGFFDGRDRAGNLGGTATNDRISNITLGTAAQGTEYNFGELPPADPRGCVFVDLNNNGVLDPGEPGIPGVAIRVTGFGIDPANVDNVVYVDETTVTDASGCYAFTTLPTSAPGRVDPRSGGLGYTISEAQPANFLDGREQNGNPPASIVANDLFGGMVLPPNGFGDGYNFGELQPPPFTLVNVSQLAASKALLLASSNTAALADQERFVNHLYNDVLGRNADQAGVDGFVSQLLAGARRDQVARAFWESAEHRGIQVDGYYQQFLGRAADAAGRQTFVNLFLRGASEVDVQLAFIGSAEYQTLNPTDRDFLTALYQDVLGRAPEQAAFDFWLPILQTPANRTFVARSILTSNEANQRVVEGYYRDLLGRTGDATGVQFWVDRIRTGTPAAEVAWRGFLASEEYFRQA